MEKDEVQIITDFFHEGVGEKIDSWAASSKDTTRHKAATAIFSAATGGDVSVRFDNQEMIVTLPAKYVEEARRLYKNNETIIKKCVKSGLERLESIKVK